MFRPKMISLLSIVFFIFEIGQAFATDDQAKLIEGAKKEGKVVYWSTGLTQPAAKALEEGYKKKYGLPKDFQVVYAPHRTTEIMAKLYQEP